MEKTLKENLIKQLFDDFDIDDVDLSMFTEEMDIEFEDA